MAPVPDETGLLHGDTALAGPSKDFTNNKRKYEASQSPLNGSINNKSTRYKQELVWKNIIAMTILHVLALQGLWYIFTGSVGWRTLIFNYIYVSFTITGVTGGSHRLWAHRTYKAKMPFRIWLMIGQTGALQNDIYVWVRDHRVHHKFTDTDADPHNSTRGFFFCHVGWLLMRKHPDVISKGETIHMSDVEADPVVAFQRKYYKRLVLLLAFILPTYVPVYFWQEAVFISLCVNVARLVISLNGTWLVNSAAHMWGYKPYDSTINPVENRFVSSIGYGEGWHNYHHTFPWDYKAAELGNYRMNFTTALLDFAARIGQVYDMKTASIEMIKKRAQRTGDGSWTNDKDSGIANGTDKSKHNFHENCVWGWGDEDMKDDEKKGTNITFVKQDT